jgi:hypothetical protein
VQAVASVVATSHALLDRVGSSSSAGAGAAGRGVGGEGSGEGGGDGDSASPTAQIDAVVDDVIAGLLPFMSEHQVDLVVDALAAVCSHYCACNDDVALDSLDRTVGRMADACGE